MRDESQDEPVGSVEAEAAKMLGALQDLVRKSGSEYAGAAAAAAGGAASSLNSVSEHIATGDADCRYCPLCQVISAVRGTSPEVKQHLTSAATSLMQAVAEAMATSVPDQSGKDRRKPGVQKIDLTDDESWEDD